MAKSKEQKEQELSALTEKYDKSKSVVFTKYLGLTVAEIQDLRRQLREENSEMVVVKKTLISLLLEKAGLGKEHVDSMDGGAAVVFGYEDEVAPARVLATFGKDHEAIGFHGGILEGSYMDVEGVTALSTLPSKAELHAKLVGSIHSPVSGIVNVLAGSVRGLVQVLHQVKEQKE